MEASNNNLGGNAWKQILTTTFSNSYELLYARAKKFVIVSEDAEDIVMNVYLKLLSNEPKDTPYNLIGYILSSINFEALDFLKKKKPVLVDDMYRFRKRESAQTNSFENKQQLELYLSEAKLSLKQQELWMYIEKEYTNAEIADILGVAADQVRKDKYSLLRKIYNIALKLKEDKNV